MRPAINRVSRDLSEASVKPHQAGEANAVSDSNKLERTCLSEISLVSDISSTTSVRIGSAVFVSWLRHNYARMIKNLVLKFNLGMISHSAPRPPPTSHFVTFSWDLERGHFFNINL